LASATRIEVTLTEPVGIERSAVGIRLHRSHWPAALEMTNRLAGPLDTSWTFAETTLEQFETLQAQKKKDPALTPQGVQQTLATWAKPRLEQLDNRLAKLCESVAAFEVDVDNTIKSEFALRLHGRAVCPISPHQLRRALRL
jgi:hypothetical protein